MNNKWMQSLALGLVMMLLIMTPSIGEEVSKDLNVENLEELIKISSLDVEIAKTEVMIAEYKLNIVEEKKGSGTTSIEVQKSNSYNIDEAEMNLAYAKSNRDETIATIVLDGKSQIYTYLIKQKEVTLLNSKILRLKDDLAKIQIKVDLGLSVNSELATKELEIQKVELEIQTVEITMDGIQLTLNQYLRWDLETIIEVLSTELPEAGNLRFNLNDIKENQLTYNYELAKLNEEKKLASDYFRLLKVIGNNDDDDNVIAAKEAIEDANYAVKDKELNVEMNVYSTYNSLLNFLDTITLNQLEVDNAGSNYERLVKRFEVGFETSSTVAAAKETLAFANLTLEQAELDYYIAYENFIRLEVIPEE